MMRGRSVSWVLLSASLWAGACTQSGSGPGDGATPRTDGGDGGSSGGDAYVPPDAGPFTGQLGTILFVTQVPHDGFITVSSTFGNHLGDLDAVPRGGDLMVRYPDGTLRNLTREAGFGSAGMQGANAIAVRDPCVHWSGNKAVFAMVVGAPTRQYQVETYRWQLYEVSGLAQGEHAVVTRVANQPAEYNNVSPIYGTDDRVIFTSDRPRGGEAHLYPQLDEYESAATNTGLWSLEPASGDLRLLEHAPSGAFTPTVDSFGRVVFTRWDHLQRDQQADYDRFEGGSYGAFTFASEAADAMRITGLAGTEVFPEPRERADPDLPATTETHTFNQFYPWQINEDGSGEETLNHVGRHEFGGTYTEGSFNNDPNLTYNTPERTHRNRFYIRGDGGMLHLREDPMHPGTFYTTYVHEFGTASAGMLLRFNGAPSDNPEDMVIEPLTHPDTFDQPDDPAQAPNSTGHYRNPLPLSDGTLVAVHTSVVGPSHNDGTTESPRWNYAFRLRVLARGAQYYAADATLTPGINADVSFWNPDTLVHYAGPLWELDPVEVRPRPRPARRDEAIEAPEMGALSAEGVDVARLRAWLRTNNLALIISRNVTYRDRADVQQPFNLRVPGGTQTLGTSGGRVYDVSHFQIFQADQVRAYGGAASPNPGRRVLARAMHGTNVSPTPAGAPAGSVQVGSDGSMAAFVPANRALTWQLTAPDGAPVVRERNWVSFAPGEIRTCAVCHGLNTANQAGAATPTNEPQALRALARAWRAANP